MSKKASAKRDRIERVLAAVLVPGEAVLGVTSTLRLRGPSVDFICATTGRLMVFSSAEPSVSNCEWVLWSTVTPLEIKSKGLTPFAVKCRLRDGREVPLGQLPDKDGRDEFVAIIHSCVATPPDPSVERSIEAATPTTDAGGPVAAAVGGGEWPRTRVLGRLSNKASEAIRRQCNGDEQPWFIGSGGSAGVLAAFEDRLCIIKTGALTSLMAGSFGGERSSVFYFSDITGVEYNSGLINGVLEVLTASYSGSANKDFWKGSSVPRNADSNDPYTLSNCLPLPKPTYLEWLPEIKELRTRIAQSKGGLTPQVAERGAPDLAEQIGRLADLHASGALTADEFAAAKARLLS